jgi:acetyltransferase-like isoleucine patch superfamily enzyme
VALPLRLSTLALRDLLGGRLRSATARGEWESLRDPRFAGPADLAILGSRVSRDDRLTCRAGLKVVGPESSDETALEVDSPEEALVRLVRHLARPVEDLWWSAEEVVARFGERARFSRLHRSCEIGEGTRIGAGVVVHAHVRIGSRSDIGDGVVLGAEGFGMAPGEGGPATLLPHRAGVVLEDDVVVGCHTNVAAGLLEPTWIGKGARIDALVQVAHNCRIGEGCILAAQVGLAGSVDLGPGCLVGGQAGFADHIRLGAGCRVAGQSGVTKSWGPGTVLVGFPARPKSRGNSDRHHTVLIQRTVPDPKARNPET